ncbi:MAG: 2OG-Fe(II) oxygenase [Deltaproteobacteria bacterium]|nr:2OG-Fe(II) oxygenase [Deltaproteobacteria bacterium]
MQDAVFVVDDVLDAPACAALIDRIERLEPEPTLVRTRQGPRSDPGRRNNTRVWFDDDDLAARVFARVLPGVLELAARSPHFFVSRPVRCERTFRGYRYRPGERFTVHSDSSFVDDDGARSLLTVLVYVNDVAAGGQTRFPELGLDVQPRAGRACVFLHALQHESVVVDVGVKYALRTNVMFASAAF